MSADNGYLLRKNKDGKFVLQCYFASADEYPSIEDASELHTFDSLEEAVTAYEEMERESMAYGYPLSEYGLTTQISPKRDKDVWDVVVDPPRTGPEFPISG